MKFSIVASILSATSAFAAPAPEVETVSMMAATPQWTIQSLRRNCNAANTECNWLFGIKPGTGATKSISCPYTVKAKNAATANGGPFKCGDYTVTSGWSGQFGAGKGFTTLSVVNNKSKLIVYPAYTDAELAGGKIVTPNKSYSPQALP